MSLKNEDVFDAFIDNGAYMFNATRLAPTEHEHIQLYYEFMQPKNNDVIVDMGCGSGEYGYKLNEIDSSLRVINITNDDKMIAFMKNANRECIHTSYENTTLADNSADIVMFNESIGHIGLLAIFPEISRILKNKGLLVIKDFSITHPYKTTIDLDAWNYTIRQPVELIHVAAQFGFSVESLIHPPIYIKHWYDLMNNNNIIKQSALQHDPKELPLCTSLYRFIKGGLNGQSVD